jgi:hypothetical protein
VASTEASSRDPYLRFLLQTVTLKALRTVGPT